MDVVNCGICQQLLCNVTVTISTSLSAQLTMTTHCATCWMLSSGTIWKQVLVTFKMKDHWCAL